MIVTCIISHNCKNNNLRALRIWHIVKSQICRIESRFKIYGSPNIFLFLIFLYKIYPRWPLVHILAFLKFRLMTRPASVFYWVFIAELCTSMYFSAGCGSTVSYCRVPTKSGKQGKVRGCQGIFLHWEVGEKSGNVLAKAPNPPLHQFIKQTSSGLYTEHPRGFCKTSYQVRLP